MSQVPALIERTPARELSPEGSPVIRIQKLIFAEAARNCASDIHIEPGRVCTRVRYRQDGVLREVFELPRWLHDNLVVRFKVLAHLDVAEKRLPQDGHLEAEATGSDDARLSTIPTRWGEKIVLRLLKRARYALSLSQLGFQSDFEEKLRTWIHRSQGILFVVGPTGSGKTTTLYGLINELRDEPLNIVTIEDPIEYEVDGITQTQIQEKAGVTFARVLRAILRQDPDVILVGEIRDAETAKTAVHAAMTGHLVLSTLHANDSVSAVFRLAELGIEPSVTASVVLGVIAQRLVRLNCRACAEPDNPPLIYLDCLDISHAEIGRCRRSPGCEECRHTGAQGRAGMFELLEISGAVRTGCASGSEVELRQAARAGGMITLKEQASRMALSGLISVDEAYRFGYFGAGL